MGRRRGHLFHPVEGGTAGMLLGHGPVFGDFNFGKDAQASVVVLAMRPPITRVPYEAARDVMIGEAALAGMADRGGAAAIVASRAQAWLDFWREDIGRPGFYPFDLLAAAYVVEPTLLRCADVTVIVGDDTGVRGWFGLDGLFAATQGELVSHPRASASALYCPEVAGGLGEWLSERLGAAPPPSVN